MVMFETFKLDKLSFRSYYIVDRTDDCSEVTEVDCVFLLLLNKQFQPNFLDALASLDLTD